MTVFKRELNRQLLLALQAKKKDIEKIEALLNAGANPDLFVKESETLLPREVSTRASPNIIKLSLAAGADVNYRDCSGLTALAIVTIKGRLDLVQILVNGGAEINAIDDEGYSVLDYAYQTHHLKISQFLKALDAKSGFEIKALQIGIKSKKIVFARTYGS